MAEIKVGDEVPVSDHGRTFTGTVTRVGRTLCDIAYGGRTVTFDLKTQRSKGRQTGSGIYFITPEDAARDLRLAAAREVLSKAKIQFDYGCKLTLEQVEALADLVSSFDKEG